MSIYEKIKYLQDVAGASKKYVCTDKCLELYSRGYDYLKCPCCHAASILFKINKELEDDVSSVERNVKFYDSQTVNKNSDD